MIFSVKKVERHWGLILGLAVLLLFLATLCSLAFGAVPIRFAQLINSFSASSDPKVTLIIQQLRLPRALLGLAVGAMLASCGAVTQGLFRNPLADPSLIGVSAGAATGASVVIVLMTQLHGSLAGLSLVSIGAFCGGTITVVFVYRLATSSAGTSVSSMLLAGIAITFLAGAFAKILEFIADNEMLKRISLWQMGGLEGANYSQVGIALGVAAVVLSLLNRHRTALNALLLGESEARHLGINVKRVKQQLIVLVAAGVGCSVALVGTVAFLGLIVPHMLRILIGPNHRYLIPLCAIGGALLMLLSDTVARTVIAPTEVPVGLITSLLGAPIFISLLRHRHRYGMQ
ncbi:MAG: iron ABC transporter permease [Cellvibrionaceae bacterium]|nr:iron ABC transporter permease [Cellvibrionaceae bacterium]